MAVERYERWLLYDVCEGCGAAYASMHQIGCPQPGREDLEVVSGDSYRDAIGALATFGGHSEGCASCSGPILCDCGWSKVVDDHLTAGALPSRETDAPKETP